MAVDAHGLVGAIRRNPTGEAEWRAWHKLVYPRLYYAAFRLARGNVEAARDLVQETFTRFLRYNGIERVTSDAGSVAYLLETCRHLAASRFGVTREVPYDDLEEALGNAAAEPPDNLELLVRELLQDLQPEDKRLMEWATDGVPLAEIARKLNISYTTAGVRVHRLKNLIRERLGL